MGGSPASRDGDPNPIRSVNCTAFDLNALGDGMTAAENT